jgi:hypothetical protein
LFAAFVQFSYWLFSCMISQTVYSSPHFKKIRLLMEPY